MAVAIKRSDRFPVGTVVKAYPRGSRKFSGPPSGTAVAEATVDAAGALSVSGLTSGTPYVLHAEVAGVSRYLDVEESAFVEPGTLKERLEARHAEAEA